MNSYPAQAARKFEFCFPSLDYTLVQVEAADGEATIRATANTFSEARKLCFIRELAAEGFLPDEYQWFSLAGSESFGRGVHWVVDNSWLHLDEAQVVRTRKTALRLVLPVVLFWGLLVGLSYRQLPPRVNPGVSKPAASAHVLGQ